MFTIILTCLIISSFYFIIRIWNHFQYWNRQNVPNSGWLSWDWANLEYPKFLEEYTSKYGKIFGTYDGMTMSLVVNEIDIIRQVCTTQSENFPVKVAFHVGNNNMAKSIFFMEANDDWKRVRSIVSPAFSAGKLRAMSAPIDNIANKMIKNLEPYAENEQEFDIKRILTGFTMDVISRCGYGIDIDAVNQQDHPVIKNANKLLNVNAGIRQIISFILPNLAKKFNVEYFDRQAIKYFDDLTFTIIDKRLQEGDTEKNDLIGLMLQEYEDGNHVPKGKKGITKDEIAGQGIIFYIAGQDTTNASFNAAVYYLTQHPKWQEKIYHEIKDIKEELSYDNLKDLPVLNAVINETLRLNPPVPLVARVANVDCTIGNGIRVKKGTQIISNPYIIHRDPDHFREPLKYLPERFIEKESGTLTHFFPFGIGNRFCAGMRFAQNELRLGLAKLILNYRLHATENTKMEFFVGSPLLSPKNMFVKLEKRYE